MLCRRWRDMGGAFALLIAGSVLDTLGRSEKLRRVARSQASFVEEFLKFPVLRIGATFVHDLTCLLRCLFAVVSVAVAAINAWQDWRAEE